MLKAEQNWMVCFYLADYLLSLHDLSSGHILRVHLDILFQLVIVLHWFLRSDEVVHAL